MKVTWLLLTFCLFVTSSEIQNEAKLEDQAELDSLENELAGLLAGLQAGTIR